MRAGARVRAPLAALGAVFLLLFATSAFAVEHPGTLHQDDNCSTCHAAKTQGKSVHSATNISCTVCHLRQTQGDMTTLTLLMPKQKICSACHEATAEVARHRTKVAETCLDCHDAHSSDQRLLLREEAVLRPGPSR